MARLSSQSAGSYFETDSAVITGPPFTVNAWCIPTSLTSDQYVWSMVDKDVTNQKYLLGPSGSLGGDPITFFRQAGGGNHCTTTAAYTINVWNMATGVAAAANDARSYLNGGNKGTSAGSVSPTGIDRTSVGRVGDSSPDNPAQDGTVAEVAVWNVALSDEEIATLYAAGPVALAPFKVRPNALVHYWRCIETAATDNLVDLVGDLHLTRVSTLAVAEHLPVVGWGKPQLWLPATAAGSVPTTWLYSPNPSPGTTHLLGP